jgi:putative phosphoesterase
MGSSIALKIAIVSDTHLPRGKRALPPRCLELMRESDLIVHAGDFVSHQVLDSIRGLGPPVTAVRGNMDAGPLRRLPEQTTIDVGGTRIAVVHYGGPSRGRLERLRARFPGAGAVVFGHSHVPLHERDGDFQIFNPGSPTDRRRSPHHTMGLAEAAGGELRFELVLLD